MTALSCSNLSVEKESPKVNFRRFLGMYFEKQNQKRNRVDLTLEVNESKVRLWVLFFSK
jgi:hypothetical protein